MTIASVLSKTSPALGSSSFITDATGYAVQHLQYLPFGETFVDQQNGYDARYTFSAKEKDDETQYSYFGARYYDSDLSVWLSVDPLSDEYLSQSPYMYCSGNPVMRIDPIGMNDGWVEGPGDEVIWDENTNSQEDFDRNYAGREGYSYVSDADNPRSYTLPSGEGKIILSYWKGFEMDHGTSGCLLSLEFKPTNEGDESYWMQTFNSNEPDTDANSYAYDLPLENSVERLDGTIKDNGDPYDYRNSGPMGRYPSNKFGDGLGRKYNSPEGSKDIISWFAQTSLVSKGGDRIVTLSWGFIITSGESLFYGSPAIIATPSTFHLNAINSLNQ